MTAPNPITAVEIPKQVSLFFVARQQQFIYEIYFPVHALKKI